MFIPDPGSDFFPSRIRTVSIPDPGSSSKNLSKPQKYQKKWFLSSKKYDPGCSSRIRMLTFSHPGSRIPDPGVKNAPNPRSRIRIRNTGRKKFHVLLLLDVFFEGLTGFWHFHGSLRINRYRNICFSTIFLSFIKTWV
jgi:hypothetical protein